MGLIKEPLNVDFFVEPKMLSDEERKLISVYILANKIKNEKKTIALQTDSHIAKRKKTLAH